MGIFPGISTLGEWHILSLNRPSARLSWLTRHTFPLHNATPGYRNTHRAPVLTASIISPHSWRLLHNVRVGGELISRYESAGSANVRDSRRCGLARVGRVAGSMWASEGGRGSEAADSPCGWLHKSREGSRTRAAPPGREAQLRLRRRPAPLSHAVRGSTTQTLLNSLHVCGVRTLSA